MGIHSNQVRDEIGGVGVLMVARFSTGFLRAITLVNALASRQFIVECETTSDSQCPVKMQLSDGFRVRYHFVALKCWRPEPAVRCIGDFSFPKLRNEFFSRWVFNTL